MPDTPTPGQVAYEAQEAALRLGFPRRSADVSPTMQAAWEAAALALAREGCREESTMPTDRSRELFPRLCDIGNALEEVRDTTLRQGALWLHIDDVLQMIDAVIDSLAQLPADGGCARHAARREDPA